MRTRTTASVGWRTRGRRRFVGSACGVWLLALLGVSATAGAQPSISELKRLSLEDLMTVEVTSVSKKEQTIADAASAVFVISQEDIRRSGATNVPEVLRLVPGLNVARIDANKWAISARGFSGRFSNKMLVLIDGRSIYTPLFAGVYWDVQDLVLEDIERIEVIRGPGATLWGANAVNGVINIISKRADDTHGTLVGASVGSEDRGIGDVRVGGALGTAGHYRVYGRLFRRELANAHALVPTDGVARGGARFDVALGPSDHLTIQGDAYDGSLGQDYSLQSAVPIRPTNVGTPGEIDGANVLARWTRSRSDGSETAVQMYFDRTGRTDALVAERRNTFDVDLQHRAMFGERHETVWGVGYRVSADDITSSDFVAFDPASRTDPLYSLFAQDEIRLADGRGTLTVGSKLEHNAYTGWEVQPSIRTAWNLDPRQMVWAAAARAVRTPSRAESDVYIQANPVLSPVSPLPLVLELRGSPDFRSETVKAYELGYRVQPHRRLSIDAAVFYNQHDNLRTTRDGAPELRLTPIGPVMVLPLTFDNEMFGDSYGVELAATVELVAGWRMSGWYTHHAFDLQDPTGKVVSFGSDSEDGPRHSVRIQSNVNLPRGFEVDAVYSRVGELAGLQIPPYAVVDTRVGWMLPVAGVEFSLTLQNLLDNQHVEFGSTLGELPVVIGRRGVFRVKWAF